MTDWVKERSLCYPAAIFKKLAVEIEQDVITRNGLLKNKDFLFNFFLTDDGKCIGVSLHGTSSDVLNPVDINESIGVRLDGKAFVYLGRDNKERFRATLTLNEDGECRLKINGAECELWRMRQMVLEELFFDII